MSKVLVRKQITSDAARAASAIGDYSSPAGLSQIGYLSALTGGEKGVTPEIARERGIKEGSPEYARMQRRENAARALAALYGGYRTMDAVASGRTPTSALGTGFGAYTTISPIARRTAAASVRGPVARTRQTTLDEFSDAKPPVAVKPPVAGTGGLADLYETTPFAAASPVAVTQPSPLERQAHNIPPGQTVFPPEYAGPAQPVRVAQPTVQGQPPTTRQTSLLASPKPGDTAEGFKTATTQTQQGQFTPKDERILSEQKKLFDTYEDPDAEEKAREQGRLMGE